MNDQALITMIYDCATKPQLWQGVLQRIADRVGAFGGVLCHHSTTDPNFRDRIFACSNAYDPDCLSSFVNQDHYLAVTSDVRLSDLSGDCGTPKLVRGTIVVDPCAKPDLRFDDQTLLSLGICFRASAALSGAPDASYFLILHFTLLNGPIAQDKLEWVETILPHMEKSLTIGQVIRVQKTNIDLQDKAIEGLSFGVAVISETGRILHANPVFYRDTEIHNILAADKKSLILSMLPAALRAALLPHKPHSRDLAPSWINAKFSVNNDENCGLVLKIVSMCAENTLGRRFVLHSFELPAPVRAANNPSLIKYGFSGAEQSILRFLVQGYTNKEIADARGRTIETVNSQVKAMLRKSQSRNRTELVHAVAKIAATGAGGFGVNAL